MSDKSRKILVTSVLLVLWGVFWSAAPQSFSSPRIYRSFMSTIPVTTVLAMGMTFLIIAGDMDMSFPSVSAAAAFVFARLYAGMGVSPSVAFAAAIFTGAVMGYLNGVLVVRIGVPSIIATIGTQFLWRGLIMLLADGIAIPLSSVRGTALHTLFVGRIGPWNVPAQALWAVVLAVFLALLLNRHSFGENILFIGDNRNTAEMVGIPVARTRIMAFILMGTLAAFAGLLATLELNNWWPTQGEGYMLLVFASVFVGGTSAYGGDGTVYGTFIGSVIIGIIEAGIVSAGLVGFWTRFVHGLVIIVSVSGYALFMKQHHK